MNADVKLPVRLDTDALDASDRRATLRAVTALAVAAVRAADPFVMLKAAWPDDRQAANMLRAVSTPATTSTYPVANVIGLFRSIAPKSAALELFGYGRSIDLSGLNTVSIPHIGALPVAPFVAEGAPGPVLQSPTSALVIGPTRKILVMAGVTRELDQATPQGAVNIVATILGDAAAKSLDAAAFGSAAASAVAPAGLLHAVTPLAASTATTALSAMFEDVGNLAEAIGDNDIDVNELVFIGGPKQAVAMKLYVGNRFDYPILSSVALKGSLAAFAAPAIASAYADLPQVETSLESMLQFNDAPATDPMTAGPTLSAFQQELINIKVRGRAAWGVHPGGAQVVNAVSW
ncbi:hypothetical protein SAMN05443247_06547 [Bradyrhizobium erythrophlei]|nr:hypothetical protein SAMN05443247_06547 [Bradyrhizobium erythrophlei]